MFEKKHYNWIFIFVILLALAGYFSGFFIDVTRDNGKYATVAKEIFENGNFINLTIHGDAYDQKPPLLFWTGAVGFYVGGVSNFWFKFPVFIIILLGMYSTFRLGKSLYNKQIGLIAASLLFFSFYYSMYSFDIHTDTPLQAFSAFAMWQLFDFIKTRRNINWIFGFIGVGLAMLSKGPIGAVIPALAIVGHLILTKNFKSFIDFRWYLGIILSFVVVSPALIGLFNQFGWEGIQFFFWKNNVGRITGSYTGANTDYSFYIHTLLYLFIPWSVLLFSSAFLEFKSLAKNKLRAAEYVTVTGIWIFFTILSVAKSKLPNYVFILLPLMAILTAKWISTAIHEKGKLYSVFSGIQTTVVIIVWLLIFGIALYIFPVASLYTWIIFALLLVLTIYIFKTAKPGITRLLLPSIIVIVAFNFFMNSQVFPYIFSFQAPPKAARIFNKTAEKNDRLYNYNYGQYELFFYSNPQASQIHNQEELRKAINSPQSWIFTNPAGLDTIQSFNGAVDTIYQFKHLYLNRPAKFILPAKREEALKPMYLVKFK